MPSRALCQLRQVWLMPQALLPSPRPIERAFRLTFTGAVPETGLSCSGVADACFIRNGGGRRPPKCEPFGASGIDRNALACSQAGRR